MICGLAADDPPALLLLLTYFVLPTSFIIAVTIFYSLSGSTSKNISLLIILFFLGERGRQPVESLVKAVPGGGAAGFVG